MRTRKHHAERLGATLCLFMRVPGHWYSMRGNSSPASQSMVCQSIILIFHSAFDRLKQGCKFMQAPSNGQGCGRTKGKYNVIWLTTFCTVSCGFWYLRDCKAEWCTKLQELPLADVFRSFEEASKGRLEGYLDCFCFSGTLDPLTYRDRCTAYGWIPLNLNICVSYFTTYVNLTMLLFGDTRWLIWVWAGCTRQSSLPLVALPGCISDYSISQTSLEEAGSWMLPTEKVIAIW